MPVLSDGREETKIEQFWVIAVFFHSPTRAFTHKTDCAPSHKGESDEHSTFHVLWPRHKGINTRVLFVVYITGIDEKVAAANHWTNTKTLIHDQMYIHIIDILMAYLGSVVFVFFFFTFFNSLRAQFGWYTA